MHKIYVCFLLFYISCVVRMICSSICISAPYGYADLCDYDTAKWNGLICAAIESEYMPIFKVCLHRCDKKKSKILLTKKKRLNNIIKQKYDTHSSIILFLRVIFFLADISVTFIFLHNADFCYFFPLCWRP